MRLRLEDDLYFALTHALEESPGLLADLVAGAGEKFTRARLVTLSAEAAQRISAFVSHLGHEPTRSYFGSLTPGELKQRWIAAVAAAGSEQVNASAS